MKLSDLLKQFKTIEPDAEFSQRTRTEILLSPRAERRTMGGVFTFLHMLETGAAVALAGFFIFILAESFSPTRSIGPVQYAVIDPAGLHAEAQAIDMQIQLADIEYPQVTSTAAGESVAASPATLNKVFAAALGVQSTSSASAPAATAGGATSTASTTTALSVDQALQQLSH
jgi:hypothetical protein